MERVCATNLQLKRLNWVELCSGNFHSRLPQKISEVRILDANVSGDFEKFKLPSGPANTSLLERLAPTLGRWYSEPR